MTSGSYDKRRLTDSYGKRIDILESISQQEYTLSGVTSLEIEHGLNSYPPVLYINEDDEAGVCKVAYTDRNTLSVYFTEAVVGTIVVGASAPSGSFDTDIWLNKNALRRAIIDPRSTDLGSLATADGGLIWFNNTENLMKYWDGSAYVELRDDWVSGVTSPNATLDLVNTGGAVTADVAAGSLDNSHIGSSAAIAFSKLASLTGNRVLSSSAGGVVQVTSWEINSDNFDINNNRLIDLADPVNDQDGANKRWTLDQITGVTARFSVTVSTTANLTAPAYSDSAGGAQSNGRITAAPDTLDGVTLEAGDHVLVKDGIDGGADANGIYEVVTLGTGSDGVWERRADYDESDEVRAGGTVYVEEGTVNAQTSWTLISTGTLTIGTAGGDDLNYIQVSGSGGITQPGNGLEKVGNTLNIVTADPTRIYVHSDYIDLASIVGAASNKTKINFDTYGRVTSAGEIVTSNGFVARTAADTFAARTLTEGNNISISFANGVSGDPIIALDPDMVFDSGFLKTDTGDGDTLRIQVYDVDGAQYQDVLYLTAGNVPSAAAALTTLAVTGNVQFPQLTTGQVIKVGSAGLLLNAGAAPSGAFVGTTDSQTLSNKDLASTVTCQGESVTRKKVFNVTGNGSDKTWTLSHNFDTQDVVAFGRYTSGGSSGLVFDLEVDAISTSQITVSTTRAPSFNFNVIVYG